MQSKIIISENFEEIKAEIKNRGSLVKIFEFETLLNDNAKEIINEAYIAESSEKIILIIAHKYGIEPQNCLLKILEEPPRNITFIIVAKSKNLLLATIRSRLIMDIRPSQTPKIEINLDLKRLQLREIYDFIEEKSALEKSEKFGKKELLATIKILITAAIKNGVKFSQSDFEYFFKLYRLADLNTKSANILTPLLLLIMQRTR